MEFQIRPIAAGDGRAIDAFRRESGVFENTLCMPSERVGRYEEYIAAMDERAHQFVAVATRADQTEIVIGTARLSVYANPRLAHSGSVSVLVRREFQGRGVGAALLCALIDVADNWLMLVRMELTVFADNVSAIRLYEKYGFQKEGVKRFAAIRGGRYADEWMMARIRPALLGDGGTPEGSP